MPDINIAWWNLENLFDRANHPDRHPDLAKEIERELKGWTAAVRNKKLKQLSKVVKAMFGGTGPDLLGVCEVENDTVLQLLLDEIELPGRGSGDSAFQFRSEHAGPVSCQQGNAPHRQPRSGQARYRPNLPSPDGEETKRPTRRFGRPMKGLDEDGFSDHFAITSDINFER